MKNALVLGIFLCSALPAIAAEPLQSIEASSITYVEDDTYIKDGKSAEYEVTCGGFVLDSDGTDELIVTAGHCLRAAPDEASPNKFTRKVLFFDGDEGTIESSAVHLSEDIGVLSVHSHHKHLPIGVSSKLFRGEGLALMGPNDGIPWTLTTAMSASGASPDPSSGYFVLECPACYKGDSGSAVVGDNGLAVGMSLAINEHGLAFMMPIREVLEDVREMLDDQNTSSR